MACRFGALSDPIAALEHAPRNPWRDYGSLMRKDILTSWPGVSTSAKDGVAGQLAVAGLPGSRPGVWCFSSGDGPTVLSNQGGRFARGWECRPVLPGREPGRSSGRIASARG